MTTSYGTERRVLQVVTAAMATELELPEGRSVDPDAVFTDSGLDSTGVEVVAGELEQQLGLPVPAELLFDLPTPRRLAAHLAGELEGEPDE